MIPSIGRPKLPAVPTVAERTLGSGLSLLAVRRTGVPLVEIRLRIPFAGEKVSHPARGSLLAESFFAGTRTHSALQIAATLQTLGATVSAHVDADALTIGGSALSTSLPALLALLGELLTGNLYPKDELAGHRERMAQELVIARSQPGTLAQEAIASRLYGSHPYGRELPLPEQVSAVSRADVRRLHDRQVRPDGAVLILVGDITSARALDWAAAALDTWEAAGAAPPRVAPPPPFHPGGVVLVERPGAVQTSIRVGGPGPDRRAGDYPATVLANLVFGGYFSSRLVANIREDKGYTYSPHSLLEHFDRASAFLIDADVASEVTAPALLELRYELGRIATSPVTQAELDAARRYAIGTLVLSTASQAGLASTLSRLVPAGLTASWLRDYPASLLTVTREEVAAAAARWLGPAGLATVLVGDASLVRSQVAPLEIVG
jgi:predicted Zn-dependent peptidase